MDIMELRMDVEEYKEWKRKWIKKLGKEFEIAVAELEEIQVVK